MMHLTVNGQPHDHQGGGALAELLAELGADPARVAVLLNDEVVPRTQYTAVTLHEGDRVEVLAFAGGG